MEFFRNINTLASFKIPAYRHYYVGMAGQWAASSMQLVVQSMLVYRITDSTTKLGLVTLASGITQVAFALFAGVLADRLSKKYLLQIAQAGLAISSLIIGIFITTGYITAEHPESWWVVLAVSAFQGITNAILMTTRQAIIPELVDKKHVVNAMALNSMGMQVFQFTAPAIGGILIDQVGFAVVYYLMGGLCILAIILTNFLPATRSTGAVKKRNMAADILGGMKYAWNNNTVLLIVSFTMLCVVIAQPLSTLLSVYADDVLKTGATGMGILQGMLSVGAFIGSVTFASIPPKKRGIFMLAGGLILGVAQFIFAFSSIWPLSLAIIVFVGIGRIGHMTPATTLLQTNTDPAYLGRVVSILNLSMGFGSLTTFVFGVLAQVIGIQWTVGSFSLLLVAADILIFLTSAKIRKMD